MNIFILDRCPKTAARYQCDKHVVKMILESAQMLSSVFCKMKAANSPIYKRTHYNHPCTVWSRESIKNFEWLLKHAFSLSNEYTLRYGKTHKSLYVINWISNNYKRISLPRKSLTPFAQAMPDKYKGACPVQAYRSYYMGEKAKFARWTKGRLPPHWWKNESNSIEVR